MKGAAAASDNAVVLENLCPYCNVETEICEASFFSMPVNSMRKVLYCVNEDYDDCPLYLVRGLTGGLDIGYNNCLP